MLTRLLTLASLVSLALVLAAVEPARAQDSADRTRIVDGYTIMLNSPAAEATTGSASIAVTIHDPHQQPLSGATVSASLLAYLPAADGHGAAHEARPPAATPDSMAGMPGMAGMPESPSVAPQAAHDHSAASATEGHGIVPVPVLLGAGEAEGSYQGRLNFDQPGTWTVGVAFRIDGHERETTFDLAVTQGRPRGLVLGGFALINAVVIGTAAVLRRRSPRRPARPAPKPVAATTSEEQH